jgi:hypothetical protein
LDYRLPTLDVLLAIAAFSGHNGLNGNPKGVLKGLAF